MGFKVQELHQHNFDISEHSIVLQLHHWKIQTSQDEIPNWFYLCKLKEIGNDFVLQ